MILRNHHSSRQVVLILAVAIIGLLLISIIPSIAQESVSPRHPLTIIPNQGAMAQYPYTYQVSGISSMIMDVDVKLKYVTHGRPADLDILLQSPSGRTVLLMSDACQPAVTSITLTLDDEATDRLPSNASRRCVTQSYRPANYVGNPDVFPAPAPSAPYATTLAAFDGQNPNGYWLLYIVDNQMHNQGSFHDYVLIINGIEQAAWYPTRTPMATATATSTDVPTETSTPMPTDTPQPTATSTPTLAPTNAPPSVSLIVSRTSFTVTEGGASFNYNVRLSAPPAAGEQVTVNAIFDAAQLAFNPTSRKLDQATWNTGRNFTVTAVDNAAVEALLNTMITHTTTSNVAGSAFNGAASTPINVTVTDND